ncbi:MAG: response regulator transcription factor, partial [Planctomycetes bacterium]|nr:response regulator transcription factor [Planctomycetota bacterium]
MRVLVIEDEPDVNFAVASYLREEGYLVDTACDGEEGLYKATTWNYDTILLDVMLPKIDGWNVLTGLRKLRKTPVLMLTARDAVNDRVKGLNEGADDYLVKPFELKEL